MLVNVNLRVTSFGQVIFEMGKPALSSGEPQAHPVPKAVRYQEPQNTASLVYELWYEEEAKDYVVPLVTG